MDSPVDTETLPHDNRGYVVIITVAVVLTVACFSVGLRIYTRAILLKQIGADDYLVLLALVLAIATGVSQCVNTRNGLGKHAWDLRAPDEILAYLKNFYVNIAFYNAGLGVIKMAFLTQYYRVLILKKFRIVCIIAMITVGSWSLSQVLIGLFLCTPVAGFWDASLNAKCIPIPLQWYVAAAGNIVTDIIIFVLPLPVLTHLELPKAQKISLVGIFSLGFFTCAISVIRISSLDQMPDYSYNNVGASAWSITELCSGVTCACLPTLRPFVSRYMPRVTNWFLRSSLRLMPYSDSRKTHVGEASKGSKGSKHTRWDSQASNHTGAEGEDRLRGLDTSFGTGVRTSNGTLNSITGFRSTGPSLYGTSQASLANPEPTPMSVYARSLSGLNLHWTQPSVTTTISTGSRDPRVSFSCPSNVYVTREITVQEVSTSEVDRQTS